MALHLHEIPRESKIRVDGVKGPIEVTFHRTDGMYSYCTAEVDGERVTLHLSVMTPLKLCEDGVYELDHETVG